VEFATKETTMKIRLFPISLLLAILMILVSGLTGGVTTQADQLFGKPALFAQPEFAADLTLVSISPSSFANGVNMPVIIVGSNLDTVVTATLGTAPLRNVAVISSTEVAALVPWSIAPGSYDLHVMDSGAQSATLTGAVTVTAASGDWTSNGPYGGDLWDVVLDPEAASRLYVSAYKSGLFKSQDSGASWNMALVAVIPFRTQIIYPTPGQPPAIYIGGDSNLGMQRSLDYGQTWDLKVPDAFNIMRSTGVVAVHSFVRPDQPNWVYASLDNGQDDPLGGLYKSTDRGDTWAIVTGTNGLHVNAAAFDPDHPDLNLVIGTTSGQVYTSTDNGSTWSMPITVTNYIGRLMFAPTLYEGKRSLWAIGCDIGNDQDHNVYRSTDGGLSWTTITIAPGQSNFGIAYHDTITGLLWSATGNGYFSEDNGDTWTALSPGLKRVHDIAVVPGAATRQTTTLFAAAEDGLYKSTDGGDTWVEFDNGLGANLARTIAISPFNADEAYAATQAKGLLHTFDGGRSWQSLPIPISNNEAAIAADPFTDGTVYVGNDANSGWPPIVRVSSDHGRTFTEYTLTLPITYTGQAADVFALAPDPQIRNRLLAGICLGTGWPPTIPPLPGLIYASTNGGATWVQQVTPAGTTCISLLTIDPQDPNVVYAGSVGSGLLRSTDRGATWTFLANQPTLASSQSLEIDPRDSNSIYLASYGDDGGVFATHDGGATWVNLTGVGGFIPTLKFVKVGPDYWLYAATTDGLRFLRTIPDDPTTPWESASGIAGIAAVTGFNAATEEGRVVYYIGTSGGTLAASAVASRQSPAASASQNMAGGIYRRMDRINLVYLPLVRR
jgi:photosystem II stability/assembly factor-like uncharacterized protein